MVAICVVSEQAEPMYLLLISIPLSEWELMTTYIMIRHCLHSAGAINSVEQRILHVPIRTVVEVSTRSFKDTSLKERLNALVDCRADTCVANVRSSKKPLIDIILNCPVASSMVAWKAYAR
jgi:hypothetical protein